MTNPHDAGNLLLSTPVATIATDIFKAAMTGPKANSFTRGMIPQLADECVLSAETIVQVLVDRGHLPLKVEPADDASADDATLILQALMFGVMKWQSYGEGDPRGLMILSDDETEKLATKLVGGIPAINDEIRERLKALVAKPLRRL